MRDPFLDCHAAGISSQIPLFLAGLLLCGALLPATPPASAEVLLKWDDPGVVWPHGSQGSQTFMLSNGVQATITIAKAAGTGGVFSATHQPPGSTTVAPLEDCGGPAACASNAFGSAHDLAVAFDPAPTAAYPPGQVVSPIIITMSFSDPATHLPTAITNLKFEITDIDFSQAGSDPGSSHRRDQVVVTSDAGNPTISFKTAAPHTFTISGNTATANCTVHPEPACNPATDTTVAPADSGTAVVDFGAATVKTVTITYNEAGNGSDPASRGIGVFGDLTPVELMSFVIE